MGLGPRRFGDCHERRHEVTEDPRGLLGRMHVEGSAPERISSSTRAAAGNGRRRTCGRAVPLDLLTSRSARSCPVIEMACGAISLRRHYPDQVLAVAGQLLRCRLSAVPPRVRSPGSSYGPVPSLASQAPQRCPAQAKPPRAGSPARPGPDVDLVGLLHGDAVTFCPEIARHIRPVSVIEPEVEPSGGGPQRDGGSRVPARTTKVPAR